MAGALPVAPAASSGGGLRRQIVQLPDGTYVYSDTGEKAFGATGTGPGLVQGAQDVAGWAYKKLQDAGGALKSGYDAAKFPSIPPPAYSLPPPDTAEASATQPGYSSPVLDNAGAMLKATPMAQVGAMAAKPISATFGALAHDIGTGTGNNVMDREGGAIPDAPPPRPAPAGNTPPKPLAASAGALPPLLSAANAAVIDNSPTGGVQSPEAGAMGALPQTQVIKSQDPDLLSNAPTLAKVGKGLGGKLNLNGSLPPDEPPIPKPKPLGGGDAPPIDTETGGGALGGIIPRATIEASQREHRAATEPKPIDVTKNLASDAGALPEVDYKRGIGDRFHEALTDPDKRALLELGLSTMAAAGQPGASLGGSLGAGGLTALASRDRDEERKQARDDRQAMQATDIWKFLTGQKNESDRQDKTQAGEDRRLQASLSQKDRENQATLHSKAIDQALKAAENGDTAAYHDAMAKADNARIAVTAQGQNNEKDYHDREIADKESARWQDLYQSNLNGSSRYDPLTQSFIANPSGQAPMSGDDAARAASLAHPGATESKNWGDNRLRQIRAGADAVQKAGGDLKAYWSKYKNESDQIMRGIFGQNR